MKNLMNLKSAKLLSKAEQRNIKGKGPGGPPVNEGPCGETGGTTTNDTYFSCITYGYVWSFNQCWVCY